MFRKESSGALRPAPVAPAGAPAPFSCTGLLRFLRRVARAQDEPHLLMLGELCGQNVTFFCERGFRVCVETDLQPGAPALYGGVLLWDALASMHPVEARRRTSMLKEIVAPGGAALAFFGPVGSPVARPRTRYRILGEELVRPESIQGRAGLTQPYENRDVVALFDGFELDHLHTRRNGQREFLFFRPQTTRRPS